MDFIMGFPNTIKQHDVIMVVVDKWSKETHFIPIKSTFKSIDVANIFNKEIFRLHGFPRTIISLEMISSPQIYGKYCLLVGKCSWHLSHPTILKKMVRPKG
jgi:hypothetical protein